MESASSSIVLTRVTLQGESSYSRFVPPCGHKSAWCFLPHQSKKENDCERGHGDVVAFFLAIRLWSIVCLRKRHFLCLTQTLRWDPGSKLVLSYAEGAKELCIEALG
jgi:hypothetical protein